MTNRYGEPVRGIRQAWCPNCRKNTDMRHLRFVGDADLRVCTDCDEELELESLEYAKPSEATYPIV